MNDTEKVAAIRELHSPIVPPEGMALLGSKPGDQHCEGCEWDDPYYAVVWPCETRRICDES